MKLLVAFCLVNVLSVALGKPTDLISSRILGGEEADLAQFPWAASVRTFNTHKCGGTILSKNVIITAANCVSLLGTAPLSTVNVNVRVGSNNQYAGGIICRVFSILINPGFGNFQHDLALIRLADDLVFDNKINKIDFATLEEELDGGEEVQVQGWGIQSAGANPPHKLQHGTFTSISKPDCGMLVGFGNDWALCLEHEEGKGIGVGDSGSGVVANDKLVGTVSFAFGAGGTKYPDVSSRISYYSVWIQNFLDSANQ